MEENPTGSNEDGDHGTPESENVRKNEAAADTLLHIKNTPTTLENLIGLRETMKRLAGIKYHELQTQANLLVLDSPTLTEIIGEECKGPLETKLTESSVVQEYLITITKPEYDEFIKPFLTENYQENVKNDGILVTMYGYQDVTKALLMILQEHKSGVFDGMYVLTGTQRWKDLCNILIQVDAFVNLWMFRPAGGRNLRSAITLARFGLPSSKIIIQRNQEPPFLYHDIVGKWSGPFSKQLRNSDVGVNYSALSVLKKHYEEFIEPLLNNHTFDLKKGVQVTMYSTATRDVKTGFLMNLRVWGSDRYALTDGWKDFCQKHEFMIKVDEFVTFWMFCRKNEENPSLCSIITSGRVAEEEKYNLPAFPPVASLNSLIEKCSIPFVKTLTNCEVNGRRELFLISKNNFVTYLEPLLNEGEKKSKSIPVTVYDADGKNFSMNLNKRKSGEHFLTKGWTEFRREHNLIKDQELVIWMFRNKVDQKLCFVIISTMGLNTTAEAEPALLQG